MRHENTFLTDERWLTLPFKQSGTAPLQKLLRELTALSAALIEVDELLKTATTDSYSSACSLFLKFGQSLENSLDLEETFINGSQEINLFPVYPLQDGTNLRFPNVGSANFFTHLWALRILCTYYMIQLSSRFPPLGTQIKSRYSTSISTDMVIHLSGLILRSMDYLISEKFKFSGAASTVLPLRVVHDVINRMETHSEELYAWQKHVIQQFRSKGYNFLIGRALEA
jgi:hypothetical protein